MREMERAKFVKAQKDEESDYTTDESESSEDSDDYGSDKEWDIYRRNVRKGDHMSL